MKALHVAIAVGFVLVGAFALEVFALNWTGFFKPKWANVERESFEQTKSYVHGKTSDLAKRYDEYLKADTAEDKAVITELVKIEFGNFDEDTIRNATLRQFLVDTRGY